MSEDTQPQPDHGRGNASVKSAALWAAAAQYCLFALQFVTSVIISRFFLEPEEVGLFSVALAAAMILSIIQDFGITRFLGKHPTADEETVRTCTIIAVLFALLLSAIIMGIAWPVSAFYDEPRLAGILMLIGLSYLFVPWSIVPIALLSRRLDFKRTFFVNFSAALTNSTTAITLAYLGFSAESLAFGMVAHAMARGIAAQIARPTPLSLPLRIKDARKILTFGSGTSLLYLSGGIGMRSPDLIVGRMLGMAAAGLYSRGAEMALHLHMLVAGAVSSIYYPAFARLRDEGQAIGPYYERVVAAHGVIVWPAMLLLAVLAEPVILLLFGEKWVDAAPLLAWVAIAECAFVAIPLHIDIPILYGKLRQLLFVNFADTALAITTLAIGASIGLEEAAAARLAYGAGWVLLYAFWMQRIIGFQWRAMLHIYLTSALVAFVTIIPAYLAVTVWLTPSTLGFGGLVVTGCVSGVAWLAAVFAFRHPARADLIGMALHAAGPVLARLKLRPA